MAGTAIYVRVSSAKDKDDTSLDTQLKDCRALAAKLGLEVTEIYSEGVLSGAELENRPQMMRLLTDIKRGKVSTALAFTWSRMSRDEWDGLEIVGLSQRHGCTWKFVNSPIPAGMEDSPESLILYAIESIRAGGERKSIRMHTGRGAEERILRGGKRNGSKPPYGWLKVDLEKGSDGKKRPGWTVKQDMGDEKDSRPATAPVVAEMYRRMAGGSSIRQVVK